MIRLTSLLVAIPLFLVSLWQTGNPELNRKLWHHQNLGKAFYENPTTQYRAVKEFEKALKLFPESPRERLNYGLSLIRAARVEEGIAQLLEVQKVAPEIPHTWFNLGILFKKRADYEGALHQFQKMVELVPDEPISHYNLGVLNDLYLQRLDAALQHYERYQELAGEDKQVTKWIVDLKRRISAAQRTANAME